MRVGAIAPLVLVDILGTGASELPQKEWGIQCGTGKVDKKLSAQTETFSEK